MPVRTAVVIVPVIASNPLASFSASVGPALVASPDNGLKMDMSRVSCNV